VIIEVEEDINEKLIKFFEDRYLGEEFSKSLLKNDLYELITDVFVIGYDRGYSEGKDTLEYPLKFSEYDVKQAYFKGYEKGQKNY